MAAHWECNIFVSRVFALRVAYDSGVVEPHTRLVVWQEL